MPDPQSGRLEFARWIASPENPLTSRVIANRVWRWHLGGGIVPTPTISGRSGGPPTHPQLLDHLARVFVDSGWSSGAAPPAHGSATYRQSARAPSALREYDPENHLFARWQPRRVEAEAFRDSILIKTGPPRPQDGRVDAGAAAEQICRPRSVVPIRPVLRRTVYLPVFEARALMAKRLSISPTQQVCGDRRSSTVASQALYLMNSPLLHESSNGMRNDSRDHSGASTARRAAGMIRHVLGRKPRPEKERAERFTQSMPRLRRPRLGPPLPECCFPATNFSISDERSSAKHQRRRLQRARDRFGACE